MIASILLLHLLCQDPLAKPIAMKEFAEVAPQLCADLAKATGVSMRKPDGRRREGRESLLLRVERGSEGC